MIPSLAARRNPQCAINLNQWSRLLRHTFPERCWPRRFDYFKQCQEILDKCAPYCNYVAHEAARLQGESFVPGGRAGPQQSPAGGPRWGFMANICFSKQNTFVHENICFITENNHCL